MAYLAYLKKNTLRRALSVGLALFVAVIVNYYFANSRAGWLVLTTFLVSQTTRGTPIRQGLIYFITIILTVFLAGFLLDVVMNPVLIDILLILVLVISGYIAYINRPLTNKAFYLAVFFSLIFSMAMLSPFKSDALLQENFLDIVMGGVISMLCMQLVLPVRVDKEFRQGLIPLLRAMQAYSQVFIKHLNQSADSKHAVSEQMQKLMRVLQGQQADYPEWAYETGFNRGLRAGFRFFLVNVERITEIFCSMNYLAAGSVDAPLLQDMLNAITCTMEKNQELIQILIRYLESDKFEDTQSDYTSDVNELENKLRQVIPGSLELLDISHDYVMLVALVRDLKDMREILLQLVMALPAK